MLIFLSVSHLIMSSLSNPWMNCFVRLLSHSMYSQSVVLVCNLPIHSWADSWLFLLSLKYCSDNTFQLWCGLHFWLSIENSPFAVLHVSCSALVKGLWVVNPPCLTSSWLLGFVPHQIAHTLSFGVWLSPPFQNSTYLSWAFQSN